MHVRMYTYTELYTCTSNRIGREEGGRERGREREREQKEMIQTEASSAYCILLGNFSRGLIFMNFTDRRHVHVCIQDWK